MTVRNIRKKSKIQKSVKMESLNSSQALKLLQEYRMHKDRSLLVTREVEGNSFDLGRYPHTRMAYQFMGRNAQAALKLGQARGSAMVACLSHDLPVSEYSARMVKQAVVGSGAADKVQVQHMVKAILSISDTIAEDAADALAVAICHANTSASLIKMAGAKSFSRKRFR